MSAFQNIAWILFAYQVKALPEIAVRLLVVLVLTFFLLNHYRRQEKCSI